MRAGKVKAAGQQAARAVLDSMQEQLTETQDPGHQVVTPNPYIKISRRTLRLQSYALPASGKFAEAARSHVFPRSRWHPDDRRVFRCVRSGKELFSPRLPKTFPEILSPVSLKLVSGALASNLVHILYRKPAQVVLLGL